MTPSSFTPLLAALWIALPLTGCTSENSLPEKTPSLFFPNAQDFVLKNPALSADQVASIEGALGTKLKPGDLTPTFHIAMNANKKPLGAALFLAVDSPQGELTGGVGLNMRGKVVRVEFFEDTELTGLAFREFLDQFTGKGIEDAFQVGEDLMPIPGREKISRSAAILPRKALLMTYALFAKKREPILEPADVSDQYSEDGYEPETLIELMEMMQEAYAVVREYFRSPANREAAVKAARQLENYIEYIDYFEPPNNPNETEEYAYFQDQVSESLSQFVDTLEKEGASANSKHQWERVLDLVDKAHLRFSIDEVDLDDDLK